MKLSWAFIVGFSIPILIFTLFGIGASMAAAGLKLSHAQDVVQCAKERP